jgi:2-oxoglutarate ferredoxin oxidoreductase subunit alpha
VHAVDLTGMTVEAVKEFGLSRKDAAARRTCSPSACCRGCTAARPRRPSRSSSAAFAKAPDIRDANVTAFKAGWNFGETTEAFVVQYEIKPAPMLAGTYRNITGNLALAYGLIAGSTQSGLPLFLGSYPITPASDILHELSKHKRFGVTTFQAEDEIAGIGAALGAAFGGALGVTTTSGPGIALKSETIGPRRDDGAAAAGGRRAARRPVHRAAHQDRAGRPAAGDVRPQRRGAGADRGAAVARRLLRRRRSRPPGSRSPTARR